MTRPLARLYLILAAIVLALAAICERDGAPNATTQTVELLR